MLTRWDLFKEWLCYKLTGHIDEIDESSDEHCTIYVCKICKRDLWA